MISHLNYIDCYKLSTFDHSNLHLKTQFEPRNRYEGYIYFDIFSLLLRSRDDNGSGRAITRPSTKRLRVEIRTRTRG
jgi:hypothetical protein